MLTAAIFWVADTALINKKYSNLLIYKAWSTSDSEEGCGFTAGGEFLALLSLGA